MTEEIVDYYKAEFDSLENDQARYKWVKEQQDKNMNFPAIMLDNDSTSLYLTFTDEDGEEDCVWCEFDDFAGNSAGLFDICELAGLRVEGV